MLVSPSGKAYVGFTTRPLEKRFEAHRQETSHCWAIKNAIQKYGWDNFEKHWYECPDDDLKKHEEMMIEQLGTLVPNGYNLTTGGEGGKHCEESRKKMSIKQSGENHPMFGKNHTDKSKKKMSISRTGEKNNMFGMSGELCPKSKRVYQFDLEGNFINTFGSVREAGLKFDIDVSSMTKSARGEKPTSGGYQWRYENISPGKLIINHGISKQVFQYDLEGNFISMYASAAEAGRKFDKSHHMIATCARGVSETAYGFKWSYVKLTS